MKKRLILLFAIIILAAVLVSAVLASPPPGDWICSGECHVYLEKSRAGTELYVLGNCDAFPAPIPNGGIGWFIDCE
jgi:hypothetical protein